MMVKGTSPSAVKENKEDNDEGEFGCLPQMAKERGGVSAGLRDEDEAQS